MVTNFVDYEQALQILRNTEGKQVPTELLNNVAVLTQIQMERFSAEEDAEDLAKIQGLYAEALKNIQSQTENDALQSDIEATQLTIKFNIATLYEASGQSEKAENLYLDLINEYPAYTDSLLRLAIMRYKDNRIPEAIEIVTEVTQYSKDNIDAWLLLGYFNLERRDLKAARHTFESVLLKLDKHHPYALTAIGNIYLKLCGSLQPSKNATPEEVKSIKVKRSEYLKKSYDCFEKAIRTKPFNMYATAGLGLYFTETANPTLARDILIQVQEASPMQSVTVSLAFVLLELGRADEAATLVSTSI